MEKFLKIFPFIPKAKETGKLVGSLFFYLLVPSLVVGIGMLFTFTIILAPVASAISMACTAYAVFGVISAVLGFFGVDVFALLIEKANKQ